jgi:hypothetical protein
VAAGLWGARPGGGGERFAGPTPRARFGVPGVARGRAHRGRARAGAAVPLPPDVAQPGPRSADRAGNSAATAATADSSASAAAAERSRARSHRRRFYRPGPCLAPPPTPPRTRPRSGQGRSVKGRSVRLRALGAGRVHDGPLALAQYGSRGSGDGSTASFSEAPAVFYRSWAFRGLGSTEPWH